MEAAGDRTYHTNHMSAIFDEGFSFSGYERDLIVWNTGEGKFANISGVSGADSISDGRGAVFADFDNDGDSDILLTTVQRKAHYLFRNNVGDRNHYLRVVLTGARSGRDAFGTVVRIVSATAGKQTKLKSGGSGYVSQSDGRLLFGLGQDTEVERLEITWPNGTLQVYERLTADRTLEFTEGEHDFRVVPAPRTTLPQPWGESDRVLAHTGMRVGQVFPSIPMKTPDGTPVTLPRLASAGDRILVNLWATWCTSCITEIPQLIAHQEALADAGIGLVGISVDLETLKEVPQYLTRMGIDYPIATTDETGLAQLFPTGESTVPLTLLLDGSGRVQRAWIGWNETVAEEVLALGASR